jgi:hypothetical protein
MGLSSLSSLLARSANWLLCRVVGRVTSLTLEQDLSRQFLITGACFHCVFSPVSCRQLGVNCLYALPYLSEWLIGRVKETLSCIFSSWGTFFGVIGLGGFSISATPCDHVRREIGWVSAGGWSRDASMGGVVIVAGDSLSTLGSCGGSALTLGVDAGVITLGAEAEADGAVVCRSIAGGCWRLEKMDCRLSIARSCLSILVGD